MTNLAQAIARAHQVNEAKATAGIAIPVQFDANAMVLLEPFNRFCSTGGLRNCPTSPKVVAAWVRSEKGTDPAKIIETLAAIELLHDVHGLSNPVATSVVRAELRVLDDLEAPRSWPQHDQLRWPELPIWTRGIIWKRERDRERWLRNKQNELAELKRNLTDGKPVIEKEGTTNVTETK